MDDSWQSRLRRDLRGSRETVNDRYELREELGRGGTAVVYRAHDLQLGRDVALKRLTLDKPPPSLLRRFELEIKVLASLSHPNLVTLFDAGLQDGAPFLVLEFVEGRTLAHHLEKSNWERSAQLALLVKVARALQYTHDRGVIHRDLKPANILITAAGEPKVADFGLVRLLEDETGLTQPGLLVGSPPYMAPEQIYPGNEPITAQTDVYALGAILYEMLTGVPPHGWATLTQMLERGRQGVVDPMSRGVTIAEDLRIVVMKAIEKDPRDRFATVGEFADDLDRVLRSEPIRARPADLAKRVRGVRRHWKMWGLAIAAASAGLFALLFWSRGREERRISDSEVALRETAADISAAFFEVNLASGDAMRAIESEFWNEEKSPGGAAAALKELEGVADRVAAAHPTTGVALAWRGLARRLAGNPAAGHDDLERARRLAPQDPFTDLFQARAHLLSYALQVKWEIPVSVGKASIPVETPGMAAELAEAAKFLARAREGRMLSLLRNGVEHGTFAEGLLLFARRNFEGTIKVLSRIVTDPLVGENARFFRAVAASAEGSWKRAAEDFESITRLKRFRCLCLAGLARHAHFRAAMMAEEKDLASLDQAIEDFSEAVRAFPDKTEVLHHRAAAYASRALARHLDATASKEDIRLGLMDADRSIQAHPALGGYLARSRLLELRTMFEPDPEATYAESLADLGRELALDPESVPARMQRSEIHVHRADRHKERGIDPLDDYVAAVQDLDWVAGRGSPPAWLYQDRGYAWLRISEVAAARNEDPMPALRNAMADHDALFALEPDSPDSHFHRGNARRQMAVAVMTAGQDPSNLVEGSIKDFTVSIQANNEVGAATNGRGCSYQVLAQWERLHGLNPTASYLKAAQDHEEAARDGSAAFIALINLGQVYLALGDFEAGAGLNPAPRHDLALAVFTRAIELNSPVAEAWRLRGLANLKIIEASVARGSGAPAGPVKEAVRDFTTALELNAKTPRVHGFLGLVLLYRGNGRDNADLLRKDFIEGIRELRLGATEEPGDASLWTNLGAALVATGETREAIESYEKALQLKPSPKLEELLKGLKEKR